MAENENLNLKADPDNKVIFICSVCSRHFPSLNEAQNHPNCGTGERDGEDDKQGETNEEESVHEQQIEHICSICNSSFPDETSLQFHWKAHELEKKSEDRKEVYLKVETDQGEICLSLNASDIYDLSEQKVALDLDSIANLNSNQSENNSSTDTNQSKFYFQNRNYVMDILQEKSNRSKNPNPILVDMDTKLNKPVNKVIDEIIQRNECITNASFTNTKIRTDTIVSEISKNKPVNQIIDEIIKRNENVTSKLRPFVQQAQPPRKPEPAVSTQNVFSIQSALPNNIAPGSRIVIGDTTYEILYTAQDEPVQEQPTPSTGTESNVVYVLGDQPENSTSQSSVMSTTSVNSEVSSSSSQSSVISTTSLSSSQSSQIQAQIASNSCNVPPSSQASGFNSNNSVLKSGISDLKGVNPAASGENYFIINTSQLVEPNPKLLQPKPQIKQKIAKKQRPANTEEPKKGLHKQSQVIAIDSDSEEEEGVFCPAPPQIEPDDVLPEKGSMPDDLYNQIMSHLTRPKNTYHKCSMCFRSFATGDKLVEHLAEEHQYLPDALFTCEICNRAYKSESGLKCHMTTMHSPDGIKTEKQSVDQFNKRVIKLNEIEKPPKKPKTSTFKVSHVKSI